MTTRSTSAARRLADQLYIKAHIFACLTALIPVYIWLSYVWTQGLFGGTGSAVLTPIISVCLGLISIRQKPKPNKKLPSNLIRLFLMGLLCLTMAVVSLSDVHSWWFGLLAVCWPLWCFVVVEVAFGSERRAQLTFPVLFLWFALPFEPFLYELVDTPLQEMTADVAVCV